MFIRTSTLTAGVVMMQHEMLRQNKVHRHETNFELCALKLHLSQDVFNRSPVSLPVCCLRLCPAACLLTPVNRGNLLQLLKVHVAVVHGVGRVAGRTVG